MVGDQRRGSEEDVTDANRDAIRQSDPLCTPPRLSCTGLNSEALTSIQRHDTADSHAHNTSRRGPPPEQDREGGWGGGEGGARRTRLVTRRKAIRLQ